MRKLAWFSGGFAAACLWACYFEAGGPAFLAAAALLGASLAVWAVSYTHLTLPTIYSV